MARLALISLTTLVACGGPQIPMHNGYKSAKSHPWKKAKTLKWSDQMEAKASGDLSYPDKHRAAWYAAELPSHGELDISLDITPPGDAVNEDFDLALEVLDPGNRVIAKSDLEEADAGEYTKTKNLVDLAPGRYLIHLYLQSRLDTADFDLRCSFKPTASSEIASDFPAQVLFPKPLPMVPLEDDTPKSYRPPTTVVVHHKHHRAPKPKEAAPPPPATTLSARIIGVSVVSGGTQITIGRGTSAGAQAGMKGKINGLSTGAFTLANCNERTCTATVPATPDQIKGAGSVVITP